MILCENSETCGANEHNTYKTFSAIFRWTKKELRELNAAGHIKSYESLQEKELREVKKNNIIY